MANVARVPSTFAVLVAALLAIMPATARAAADGDGDGIPDLVEPVDGTNPAVRDNQVFGSSRLFVKQQYRDFLAREGDAGGINAWTNVLDSGSQNRAAVILNFYNTVDFQGWMSPVTRLYFAYFLRIPDYDGLLFWVGRYRQGTPLAQISAFFASSAEFVARYGSLSNRAFVIQVYRNVLGREPDTGGLNFWLDRLDRGIDTRGSMMIGFSESAEYRTTSAPSVFVTQIYAGMRREAPDQPGFDYWKAWLSRGGPEPYTTQYVVKALYYSAEYHDRFLDRTIATLCERWKSEYWTRTFTQSWDGPTSGCDLGTLRPEAIPDGLSRTNLFRDAVGLPPITEKPAYTTKALEAAVLDREWKKLDHFPPNTLDCWTSSGADGAASSNLGSGYGTITEYVDHHVWDLDTPSLEHRRWLFYPPYSEGGFGLVYGGDLGATFAQWIKGWGPDPGPAFVAYPAPGAFPWWGLRGHWSFSVKDADFSTATVSVRRSWDHALMWVRGVYVPANGFGYNTIAWDVPDFFPPESYIVTVTGVRNAPKSTYTYTTTITDCQ